MPKRKQKKGGIRIFPLLIFLVVVLFALRINAMHTLDRAVDPEDTSSVVFEVASGSSADTISDELKSQGLILSKYAFKSYLSDEDLDQSIQAGRYVLNPSMTTLEIIETLTGEGSGELTLTVIEGWTISDIDEYLTNKGLIESGEFKGCTETCDFSNYEFLPGYLEGYLFPDTFFVDAETFDVESYIRRLLDNFQSKISDLEIPEDRTLEEIIIAASIIEKEVISDEDRAIVSGILWKRLDNEWALGMCSTINYITGESEISYEDIAIDSPYNTRQVRGLPPTPISNPGMSAINAALNPVETDYWFFLTASDTGETIYSVSDEEHEANKARYL